MDETIQLQRELETGVGGTQGPLQDLPEGLETEVLTGQTNLYSHSQPQPRSPRLRLSELTPWGSREGAEYPGLVNGIPVQKVDRRSVGEGALPHHLNPSAGGPASGS